MEVPASLTGQKGICSPSALSMTWPVMLASEGLAGSCDGREAAVAAADAHTSISADRNIFLIMRKKCR